jgi:hypothetical protein
MALTLLSLIRHDLTALPEVFEDKLVPLFLVAARARATFF